MPEAREPGEWRCESCALRNLPDDACFSCGAPNPELSGGASAPSAARGVAGCASTTPMLSPSSSRVGLGGGSTQAGCGGAVAATPTPSAASTNRRGGLFDGLFGGTSVGSSGPVAPSLPPVAQSVAVPPAAQHSWGAASSALSAQGGQYGGATAQAGYGYHGAAAAHSFAPAPPFTSGAPALPPAATPPPALSVGSYRAAWPWLYPSAAPNTFGRYDGRGGSAASAYPDQMRSGGGTTTNAGAGIRDILADRTNLEFGSGSGGGGGSSSRSRSRSGSSSARKFRRTWAWDGSGGAGSGGNGSPGGGGSGTSTARHGGGGAEAGPTRFSDTANADHVAQLTSMGYPADRARAALRDAGGNLEQAVETLLTPNTQGGSSGDPVDLSGASPSSNGAPVRSTRRKIAPPTAAEPECNVCMERPVNCTLVPCGHHCCCTECAAKFDKCPICRAYVSQKIKTFKA